MRGYGNDHYLVVFAKVSEVLRVIASLGHSSYLYMVLYACARPDGPVGQMGLRRGIAARVDPPGGKEPEWVTKGPGSRRSGRRRIASLARTNERGG